MLSPAMIKGKNGLNILGQTLPEMARQAKTAAEHPGPA
jgi:hypothetical protein